VSPHRELIAGQYAGITPDTIGSSGFDQYEWITNDPLATAVRRSTLSIMFPASGDKTDSHIEPRAEENAPAPRWGWGLLLPTLDYRRRLYNRCYRCRRPWWAASQRSVQYRAGQSQCAMCVRCWKRSSVDQRRLAHRWVTQQAGPRSCAADIEAVVSVADDGDGFLSWPELDWLASLRRPAASPTLQRIAS
jgi:hypothetical protein